MLAFEDAEERNAFEWNDEFLASLGEVTTEMLREKLQKLGHQTGIDISEIPDTRALIKELGELLEKYGIGGLCEAFVIDCDLAKDWRKLFTYWRNEKVPSQRERSVSCVRLELWKKD